MSHVPHHLDHKTIVDWDAALKATGGNADLLQTVVKAVLLELPDLKQNLKNAIEAG